MKPFLNRLNATFLIASCAVCTLAIAVFSSKSKAADPPAPTIRPALSVSTVTAQPTRLPLRLAANGNLAAWQEASVGSEIAGLRLSQVNVNVGERVKKGALLALLADDSVRAELAQASAALAEAQANVLEAAANAERARRLQPSGALSQSQVDQSVAAEQGTVARLAVARAQQQLQQLRLQQTRIVAPDDGIVSARLASVGAVVAAGSELFKLIRQGRLEWRAEVTASELGRIARGTHVQLSAASGARLTGQVRMVGPTVDPQSRNALVYVDVWPAPGSGAAPALPGMFAHGEFELGDSPALTLPQSALALRDGFSYVYRVDADGRVAQLKVGIGRIVGEHVEISSGLSAGTRVVASGAGFLNHGDRVRVVDAAAAPVAAVSAAKTPIAPVLPASAAIK